MIAKKTVLAVAMCLSVMASYAGIIVNWYAPLGFYSHIDSNGLLDPDNNFAADDGSAALAQLIFSTDNVTNGAFTAGATTGDDQILDTVVLSNDNANAWGAFFPVYYSNTYSAGYLYVRVFDRGSDITANIVDGTWYYDSAMVATVNNNDPLSPTDFNGSGNQDSGDGFGTDNLFRQVAVPEPGTMAFLGLGAVVMALRRRKK